MHPITIILAAILLALSIILRSVDIFRFNALGVDTFANLLYSEGFENVPSRLYKVGKIVYPPFLPALLRRLRVFLSTRQLHLVPKFFDILTSLAIFFFTLWLSGNESAALLALLIFTFSPISVINSYGISARNIGSFFFASACLTSYIAMSVSDMKFVMIILAIASSVLMIFTSRIAYKSYYILTVVITFLLPLRNMFAVFLLVSVVSLFLSLLLTRGKFLDDIKGQVFLINFFRKRRAKEKTATKRTALVFYYDLWWCPAILAIIGGADLFLAAWLLTMVSLSFLWPWGEGERHIALANVPASILAGSYLVHQPYLAAALLFLEAVIIIRISIRVLHRRYLVTVDRPLYDLFNSMKNIEGDPLFLCLPTLYNLPLAYFTGKKVLYGESSSQEGVLFQAEVDDSVKTETGVEELASKYPVTHLFVDRSKFPFTIDSNLWNTIIQEECFTVFRRKTGKK
jgi:hypothetical protein